jgi:hypothetical protein
MGRIASGVLEYHERETTMLSWYRNVSLTVMLLMVGILSWQMGALVGTKQSSPSPEAETPNDTPIVQSTETSLASLRDTDENETGETAGEPSRSRFLDAKSCALCHSNSDRASAMRDSKQREIAPYDLWQASMMANSARDPFWRAVLSAEVVATPSKKALIEEKCTRCHAPMAGPGTESPKGDVLAFLKKSDQRAHLGLDGVSCTVCHQITDKGLGTDASFTGHFEISKDSKIFGPHADPFVMPMQHHVGYTPTQGNHILKSGLCATCHMLITTSVDPSGAPSAGEFHEQSPYLEWRNSVYNDELESPSLQAKSCQACHMPTKDADRNEIATQLAHNPGGRDFPFLKPRSPFGRHTFSGANTLMKQILRDNAKQLGVSAPSKAFDASIEMSKQFLNKETASLELKPISFEAGKISVNVEVRNLGGHKLPTAYPSRRVWILLTVKDQDDKLVYSSGQYNSSGELIDGSGLVLASENAGGPINPHYKKVNASNQVQVYEAIMADASGSPTFTLLRGATYLKDNRLLPLGWKPDHADGPATQPFGIGDDSDFIGGNDSVQYEITVPSNGTYAITARLLFQVISPRHANELFLTKTSEVDAFMKMFQSADRTPEELASATLSANVKD